MSGINLKDVKPFSNNPRSNFDLSFTRKFDTKFGRLYPFLMEPVMPSDKFSVGYEAILRMAPFVSQVFQRYICAVDYYYVPSRVLWNEFDNFMTAGYNGQSEYIHPYIDLDNLRKVCNVTNSLDTIFDALDLPLVYMYNSDDKINALPFYAYYKVIMDYWLGTGTSLQRLYEYFMNTNTVATSGDCTGDFLALAGTLFTGDMSIWDDGFSTIPNIEAVCGLVPRLYPLDYFTEARPNPQLGPVMTIPIKLVNDGGNDFVLDANATGTNANIPIYGSITAGSKSVTLHPAGETQHVTVNADVLQNVMTIPDFYSAARIQELLQLYGYTGFMPQDTIAAEFGVKSSDTRFHRSQAIFHDQFDISIGEVFSNNVNTGGQGPVPSGNDYDSIAGVGTAIGKANSSSRGFQFDVPEFGYIVGLLSVYPESGYYQGVPRHFMQLDRFDYPHPLFAQLGMQEIKRREIFADLSALDYDDTFAYTPRYSEYKVHVNRSNGQLNGSLNYMHAGRKFDPLNAADVVFDDNFLRVLPGFNSLNRTFNVDSDLPHDNPIFVDIHNYMSANRPLPYYGLPKF